jgi:hypothetical protein
VGVSHSWFPVLYGSLVNEEAWRNSPDYLANFYDSIELGSVSLSEGESLYLGFQLGSKEFLALPGFQGDFLLVEMKWESSGLELGAALE